MEMRKDEEEKKGGKERSEMVRICTKTGGHDETTTREKEV